MYSARRSLSAAAAVTILATGCGAQIPEEGADLQVAVAFYPLEYAVQSVGDDDVDVIPLTTPGVESHDVELTPRQVSAVVGADLVVYLSGFQPAVDDVVAQTDPARVLDVAQFADLLTVAGEDQPRAEGLTDPHFWLDPTRLSAVSDAIADRLADIEPSRAEEISSRAATVGRELGALDEEFASGLESCERREIFVAHNAFGYLAHRYDLQQVSVAGLSPHVEPSGARIADIQKRARLDGATTIFFERSSSDAVARSIAQDLGLETAVLDPIETITDQSAGRDYPAIMRANLAALRKANDCD